MEKRPECFQTGAQEVATVFLVCVAQFLCQGGITMCMSTMKVLIDSFAEQSGNIEESEKVWFMGSFALTVGTFILVSGRLGDLFGLKKIFLIGWAWITVWSIVIGLSYYSKSITFFIICRAFQGIGFALLLPCGLGILGSVYANGQRKNIAFSCLGAAGPLGAAVGAIMAAVFAQFVWWPWQFWVQGIATFVFGVASYYAIPPDPQKSFRNFSNSHWVKRLDVLGSGLGIASLILFNFVWNHGPVAGWKSPYVLVLLILSVIGAFAFFYVELKVAEYPLLPRSLFNRKIGLVLLCVCLGWGSFGIWQYYYWNTVLILRGYSPIEAGLTYIPFLVLGVIASLSISVIITRVRPSIIIAFSMIAFMCGSIMLSIMPVKQSYFQIAMGQMFILTWGMDWSFPASSLILSDFLPVYHQGMAGSLVNTVVNYSVSLFLGIATTIETQVKSQGSTVLQSYRAALHFAIGTAGLGVVFALVFVIIQHLDNDKNGTFASASDTPTIESKRSL